MQRDVLTVLETASALNLHPETVKRFCRIGKLKGEKVSVGWLIPRTEVQSSASTYKEIRGRVLRTDMLGILKSAWARRHYGKSIF